MLHIKIEGQKMFQILAKAQELERQGKEIIHFEIGDPDFDTPKSIVEAACEALKKRRYPLYKFFWVIRI